MKKSFLFLFILIFFFFQLANSQIVDTTFTLDGIENCLHLSDTTKVNVNSIVVGFEKGLKINSSYQVTLSGKAYFYYDPQLNYDQETSELPLSILEIPGAYLLYTSDKGSQYNFISMKDTVNFVPVVPFFYAFLADRKSVADNGGEIYLRLKEISPPKAKTK
jgi:hypothetical protein